MLDLPGRGQRAFNTPLCLSWVCLTYIRHGWLDGSGTAEYLLKIGCSLLLVHFVAMTHDNSLLRLARWCVVSGKTQSAPQTYIGFEKERERERESTVAVLCQASPCPSISCKTLDYFHCLSLFIWSRWSTCKTERIWVSHKMKQHVFLCSLNLNTFPTFDLLNLSVHIYSLGFIFGFTILFHVII